MLWRGGTSLFESESTDLWMHCCGFPVSVSLFSEIDRFGIQGKNFRQSPSLSELHQPPGSPSPSTEWTNSAPVVSQQSKNMRVARWWSTGIRSYEA